MFCFRNVAYHSEVTGPDMGLILLVNGSSDDYFYSIFNSIGFNVRFCNNKLNNDKFFRLGSNSQL